MLYDLKMNLIFLLICLRSNSLDNNNIPTSAGQIFWFNIWRPWHQTQEPRACGDGAGAISPADTEIWLFPLSWLKEGITAGGVRRGQCFSSLQPFHQTLTFTSGETFEDNLCKVRREQLSPCGTHDNEMNILFTEK